MDAKQMSVLVLVAGLVLATLSPAIAAPMSDASGQEQQALQQAVQEAVQQAEHPVEQQVDKQAETTMRSGDATSMFTGNNDSSSAIANHVTGYVKDSLHIINKTSTFTCFGREMGYYADTERDCRIYFFCMAGDYNGELVYQRISYLCLNEDVFDQQALDCVPAAKSTTKCAESGHYFSTSNQVLRSAIASSHYENQHMNSTSAATTPHTDGAAPSGATSSGEAFKTEALANSEAAPATDAPSQ